MSTWEFLIVRGDVGIECSMDLNYFPKEPSSLVYLNSDKFNILGIVRDGHRETPAGDAGPEGQRARHVRVIRVRCRRAGGRRIPHGHRLRRSAQTPHGDACARLGFAHRQRTGGKTDGTVIVQNPQRP